MVEPSLLAGVTLLQAPVAGDTVMVEASGPIRAAAEPGLYTTAVDPAV